MRRIVKHLATAAGLSFVLVAAPAQATFSNLVVFGDSLSDNGNVGLALHGANVIPNAFLGVVQTINNDHIPDAPYPITSNNPAVYPFATFSNGPVWASLFAQKLGTGVLLPSLAGGSNYSFAGARISNDVPVPSLKSQLGTFLPTAASTAPSDAFYIVGGGGNDARDGIVAAATDIVVNGTNPAVATANAAAAAAAAYAAGVESIVQGLQAAGAVDILVFNTPNVGLIPALQGSAAGAIGTAISGAMNQALAAALADEQVKIFDAFSFVSGLASPANPLGLVNTTDACGGVAGADCSKYLFWDGIHPTARVHQAIADAVYAQAVPEPSTWILLASGLGFVVLIGRRRRG